MSTGTPHRRSVAAMLLLIALGMLALAVLGASADRGTVRSEERTFQELATVTQDPPEQPELPDNPFGDFAPPPGDGAITQIVTTVVVVLAALALLALALWVVTRMRQLSAPAKDAAAEVELPEEVLTEEQARSAIDAARAQLLSSLGAQDAVIAAWLSLEKTISTAGIRRDPSQTTFEYVVTVLGSLSLRESDLNRLADLYRRALFDPDPLQAPDRASAVELLDALTVQLSTLDTGTGRDET